MCISYSWASQYVKNVRISEIKIVLVVVVVAASRSVS